MYGAALPILYPIAWLAFVVVYITEKLLVFYYYKQPPSFDAKMTFTALDMITWAPIWFLAMSYWFFSNN